MKVQDRINNNLQITGVVATKVNNRKILNKDVVKTLKAHFKDKFFNTLIRDNVSLAEAPSHGMDIFEYRKESPGAEDYASLSDEIIKMERVLLKDIDEKEETPERV